MKEKNKMNKKKKQKYIVKKYEGDAHGGLNELEANHYFDIIDVKTGEKVMGFSGEYYSSLEGNGT